ncbi:MAG: GntR family transcriptional regulator [Fastidiosipila sp.]|jgi:GntR family transcriptional regulator|nr:GntR family transcriptional regulator [Fastidiosipila sp.]HPX93188.1 GntR family transcriptional regulator [Bacillota bacterium]
MTDHGGQPSGLLYRKLVDLIRQEIQSGKREPGQQLPSIRDAAASYGVSVGTMRHVYGLLERDGLIRMQRGRGTFVAEPEQAPDPAGRKDKALTVIDRAIHLLSGLGFTAREMAIFFELRLRQKEESTRALRLAIVAATAEERSIIHRPLTDFRQIQIDRIPYSDVTAQPERLAEGYDLLVAPAGLCTELESLALPQVTIMPVVLAVSPETLLACQKLPKGARIGVLTVSRDFSNILKQACGQVLNESFQLDFALFGNLEKTRRFVERHEVIILPPDYISLVGSAEAALFRGELARGRTLIRTAFNCDQGSLLYLTRAIEKKYGELREWLTG